MTNDEPKLSDETDDLPKDFLDQFAASPEELATAKKPVAGKDKLKQMNQADIEYILSQPDQPTES